MPVPGDETGKAESGKLKGGPRDGACGVAQRRGWRDDLSAMKAHHLLLSIAAAILSFGVVSCAENQEAAANSTNTNPAARTRTSDDLQRTGRQSAGEALQASDPAVSTSTGGR